MTHVVTCSLDTGLDCNATLFCRVTLEISFRIYWAVDQRVTAAEDDGIQNQNKSGRINAVYLLQDRILPPNYIS